MTGQIGLEEKTTLHYGGRSDDKYISVRQAFTVASLITYCCEAIARDKGKPQGFKLLLLGV